ncbi:mce related protein [Bacteroidetes oral taxon 274 str. F0058]|jgi:mce family protein|nr:mce related protein [Bacteroidetes oral taxon 274 str. F0058]
MDRKISKELKIGLTFVITIIILFFGLNFLKGINIFSSTNTYYAVYKDIDGLVPSNTVSIKGYKVGQVKKVRYNFNSEKPFLVEVTVNKDIKLPKGTVFYLADEGLISGKMIDISLGTGSELIKPKDTVPTDVRDPLTEKISEYMPQISSVISNLEAITHNVNVLLTDESLKHAIGSLGPTVDNLNKTINQLRASTASLPSTMDKFNGIATTLDNKLNQFDVNAIMTKLNNTLANAENFTQKLNNRNSSLGLLLNDRTTYDKLNSTIQSADNLLIDIKENPKRYINVSVFGSKK